MGKKMKLPFLFRTSSEAWPWPTSCGFIGNPKTLSFRADNADNSNMLKTLNSAYRVDEYSVCSESPAPESFSSSSSSSESYGGDCVENVIRGLRSSERLFFEPEGARSSKLLEEEEPPSRTGAVGAFGIGVQSSEEERPFRTGVVGALGIGVQSFEEEPLRPEAGCDESFVFKEGVEMEIASRNPFADFRRSMEEMVEAHGGEDWKFLEELLACYLRINGKTSHGYIVGAFVDLLVELFMDQSLANEADDEADTIVASSSSFTSSSNTYSHCLLSSSSSSSSSTTTTHSFTSPLSFCSSLSSLLEEAEDETEKSIHNASSSSSSSSSSPSPPHFA